MFRRKLDALKYELAEGFSIKDETKVRALIFWLEDQKIRHYLPEERNGLRQTNSPQWTSTYHKYLSDLSFPSQQLNIESSSEVIEWLLSFATRLEYTDNLEKYNNDEDSKRADAKVPKMVTKNPLDKLDFGSPEFKEGVNKLAELLEITKHPNHLITLEAIAQLVKTRMSKASLENIDELKPKGKPYPILEVDMGFDSGDYVTNQAAKILRLLYIHDLRTLQTMINECIVSVQTVSANPKTDTKLGKVGF